jgi:cation:H+ antiporter
MFLFYLLIFLISGFFLIFSSHWLIKALTKIAKFLGWKEFVVAFFLMAFGVSVPNFFVGIVSALNKTPELSFGDVIGGNIVDLSLVVGLAALISRNGLSASSRTVQGSSIFTILIAVLPLILISDGILSRSDSLLLFLAFFGYIIWLFSKRERFKKIYDGISEPIYLSSFLKNFLLFFTSIILLVVSAYGIVKSANFFAQYFNLPLSFIGILLVGLGDSLPEGLFSIQAARRGEDWLLLGDLMGGVVITATLVLGIVSLLCPIKITNFLPFAISRIFLIITVIFFLICLRTGRKITQKEGLFLLAIYITFLLVEILIK